MKNKLLFIQKSTVKNPFAEFLSWIAKKIIKYKTRKFLKKGVPPYAIFSFDLIGRYIQLQGGFEREQLECLMAFFYKLGIDFSQSTALDVGANIGYHSVFYADYFKTVQSFEPSLRTFYLLKANSLLKDNIICHNVGASDKNCSSELSKFLENHGGAKIGKINGLEIETVKLVTLDSYLEETKNITFIKIDVEGHEVEALRGCENIIRKNNPIITFEVLEDEIQNETCESIEVLKDLNYKMFAAISKSSRLPSSLPIILRSFLNRLLGWLFPGPTVVKEIKTLEKKYYEMIIAMPDWLLRKLRNS